MRRVSYAEAPKRKPPLCRGCAPHSESKIYMTAGGSHTAPHPSWLAPCHLPPGEGIFAPLNKKSPEPIGSGGFLFFFSLWEQVGHAFQADAQGGHVVKQGRGRWGQEARHAADNEGQIEAYDKAVIPADPVHQRLG